MISKEFSRRRMTLARMVGAGGIAILPAAPVRTRSRDVEYRFRQDSDFYYLTGFAEPDAVAVIVPGRASVTMVFSKVSMFSQKKSYCCLSKVAIPGPLTINA